MQNELLVAKGEGPKRLDRYLAGHQRNISRSHVRRLIELGRIHVNGRTVKPSRLVRGGDRIEIETPPARPLGVKQSTTDLEVLWEDEDLLVINKPIGVVMHPGSGHWEDTLFNALLYYLAGQAAADVAPRLVHRLDKDTSGAIVVAKTVLAHRSLCEQFALRQMSKQYLAIVQGCPGQACGVIEAVLGRGQRKTVVVAPNASRSKQASTEFVVLLRLGSIASCLALTPRTGRTHQLRVHLQSVGHAILGDPVYGGRTGIPGYEGVINRLMLHAHKIGYRHPRSGQYQEYFAPVPLEMRMLQAVMQPELAHNLG